MPSRRITLPMLLACLALLPTYAHADTPKLSHALELRVRGEAFDASHAAGRDSSYELLTARLRASLDLAWPKFTLHGMVQGAGIDGIPRNADFGLGGAYFAANQDDSAEQLTLGELSASFTGAGWKLSAGRLAFSDGNETPTGVKYLDGIKRRRLAERLVGNSDFTLGRRFDGASFALDRPKGHLAVFALQPTSGLTDYDGFEHLEDVAVAGATYTAKYGVWLPKGELRFFALGYRDERAVTERLTRGQVEIVTIGSSLLLGNANSDLLAWFAVQRGDWGARDHEAFAVLVEGGRAFAFDKLTLTLRGGFSYASGDDDPTDGSHDTFANLLPTNHKYYGSLDYVALQNLRELMGEAILASGTQWNVRLGLHHFSLAEKRDAWYFGSGAVNEDIFGYTGVTRAGGFRGAEIGSEVDLETTLTFTPHWRLDAGVGQFFGGDVAEARFANGRQDGSWANVQLIWTP